MNYSEMFREANEGPSIMEGFISNKTVVIAYLIIGLILMILYILIDMRGKEFNKDYFNNGPLFYIILVILWPYFLFILTVGKFLFETAFRICEFLDEKSYINRMLYKIANIGYKEKKHGDELDVSD